MAPATHPQFYVRSTDDSVTRAAVTSGAVLAAASGSRRVTARVTDGV